MVGVDASRLALACYGVTKPPQQSLFIVERQFVLPNSKHAPAAPLQSPGYQSVTSFVSRKFLHPKGLIARGTGPVLRAAVPKAPVDENRNSALAKYKIWVSEYPSVTAPTDDGMAT
jgi:hypothetical protein